MVCLGECGAEGAGGECRWVLRARVRRARVQVGREILSGGCRWEGMWGVEQVDSTGRPRMGVQISRETGR